MKLIKAILTKTEQEFQSKQKDFDKDMTLNQDLINTFNEELEKTEKEWNKIIEKPDYRLYRDVQIIRETEAFFRTYKKRKEVEKLMKEKTKNHISGIHNEIKEFCKKIDGSLPDDDKPADINKEVEMKKQLLIPLVNRLMEHMEKTGSAKGCPNIINGAWLNTRNDITKKPYLYIIEDFRVTWKTTGTTAPTNLKFLRGYLNQLEREEIKEVIGGPYKENNNNNNNNNKVEDTS